MHPAKSLYIALNETKLQILHYKIQFLLFMSLIIINRNLSQKKIANNY